MPAPSWLSWKKSLVCKSQEDDVHDPHSVVSTIAGGTVGVLPEAVFVSRRLYKSGCSRSIANLRDVIHASKRIEKGCTSTTNLSPRSLESSDIVHSTSSAAHQAIFKEQLNVNAAGNENADPKLSLDDDVDIGLPYNIGSSSRFNTPLHNHNGAAGLVPLHYSPYGTPIHHGERAPCTSSFKRFSGCYDCKNPAVATEVHKSLSPGVHGRPGTARSNNGTAIEPPIARPTCQRCGDVFPRHQELQQHHLLKHAVTELEVGDSSRNVVEIIFRTSWALNLQHVAAAPENDERGAGNLNIERIVKVNHPPRTIARFEEYREGVKVRASKLAKRHVRCLADGNELLRFYGATLECGLPSPATVCSSGTCAVCRIIRHGFAEHKGTAILTTATSGRAHRALLGAPQRKTTASMAILVCRVIAGRVHRPCDASRTPTSPPAPGFDSVAGAAFCSETGGNGATGGGGASHCKFEELCVFNPRAILPCFVVIYKC